MKNLYKAISITGITLAMSIANAGGCPTGKEGKSPFTAKMKKEGTIYVHNIASTKLDDQTIAAKGWNFRARTITFAPGAIVPLHSHEDRPETAMMKTGSVTVYEGNCTVSYEMKEGDTYQSAKGDTHWVINETDNYAVMYVVDLVSKDTFPH